MASAVKFSQSEAIWATEASGGYVSRVRFLKPPSDCAQCDKNKTYIIVQQVGRAPVPNQVTIAFFGL